MLQKSIGREQKLDLARGAMRVAMDARFQAGLGLEDPICTYAVCERLGIPVRFVDVSMEGIYRRGPLPRIFLSAHRPLARRHFNCAHELGHHLFGHGATLDEIRENLDAYDDDPPEEFQANSFAGHFLMPVLGVRRAFARRGLEPGRAVLAEIMAVATEFGVSIDALLTQLTISLKDIAPDRRRELLRARQTFRAFALPQQLAGEIALLDAHFAAPTLDIEINHLVIAPSGAIPDSDILASAGSTTFGSLYRAVKRGTVELFIPNSSWVAVIRVAPERFVGLARYRYLEDD